MKPNWFVAFPVTEGAWLSGLKSPIPPDLRLFLPEDLHLTVAFLGAMDPDLEQAVSVLIRSIEFDAVCIEVDRLTALPRRNRFSAISAIPSSGASSVSRLVAEWRDPLCRVAGAKPDQRRPLPHITIGRPTRKASPASRQEILDWADQVRFKNVKLKLDALALYTWSDDRKERQFKVRLSHSGRS